MKTMSKVENEEEISNEMILKTDEDDVNDSIVNSSAIVKYDVVETPAMFFKLQNDTNLNLPPPNWLRGESYWDINWFESLRGHWAFPRSNSNRYFSSFRMAYKYPDCVGEVDVISDAENIKQLLKIPFNDGTVSMIVHRVGKTLLIDQFDIHTHLLRTSQTEWDWFRKFFFEQILQSFQASNEILDKANKSRDHLQDKNLFSKFLHYSVANDSTMQKKNKKKKSNSKKSNAKDSGSKKHSSSLPVSVTKISDVNNSTMNVQEKKIFEGYDFQRNVIWTFEDIRMLIGSDMPIFGGGTHPAVSLRLREMTKPIKVLTGLDYWLDNLMCNVPEVIMCFHHHGFVKKYERIKTENIPNLKNSRFSPNVVKDIAQNILSFLKGKATKSGHTYWLFKGKADEAVKLYDLTGLCPDVHEEPEINPYTVPVAMLLFKMANKIHGEIHRSDIPKDIPKCHKATLYKLLTDCLALIDAKKHQELAVMANFLMAELFIPNLPDLVDLNKEIQEFSLNVGHNHAFIISDDEISDEEDSELENIAAVNVDRLSTTQHIKLKNIEIENKLPPVLASSDLVNRCKKSVEYCKEVMSILLLSYPSIMNEIVNFPTSILNCLNDNTSNQYNTEAKVCKQTLPGLKLIKSSKKIEEITCWKLKYCLHLLLKLSQNMLSLAKAASRSDDHALALIHIKEALINLEKLGKLAAKCELNPSSSFVDAIRKAYYYMHYISGDLFMSLASTSDYDVFYKKFCNECNNFLIKKNEEKLINDSKIKWIFELPKTYDCTALLRLSIKSHRAAALFTLGSHKCRSMLNKRLANGLNTFGSSLMEKMLYVEVEKALLLYDECEESFSQASKLFLDEGDIINKTKVEANLAKLCRILAFCYSNNRSNTDYLKEEINNYKKAIKIYKDAFSTIQVISVDSKFFESLSWDMNSSIYSLVVVLQDVCPPELFRTKESSKVITELLQYAINFCEFKDGFTRNSDLFLKRKAVLLYRNAHTCHLMFRNLSPTSPDRQKYKHLAESSYQNSALMFFKLEHYQFFLRATLREIEMQELHLKDIADQNEKAKILKHVIGLILSSVFALRREQDLIEKPKKEQCNSLGVNPPEFSLEFCPFPGLQTYHSKSGIKHPPLWTDDRENHIVKLLGKYLQFLRHYLKNLMVTSSEKVGLVKLFRKMFNQALPLSKENNSSVILSFLEQQYKLINTTKCNQFGDEESFFDEDQLYLPQCFM